MKIKKRNLLCIKKKENLDLGHLLLYKPYKNILLNFEKLMTDPRFIEFDPVSRVFSGLESVSEDIKHYYESLLGVTSYYQASKGGRGKYIEKKLSSIIETCSLDIKLSELPTWLTYPLIHRKKGIFTLEELSSEEKSILRKSEWDWLGDKEDDETIDLGSILENKVIFIELKNRIDSGGTAARREIWNKKFKTLLILFSNTKKKIYRKGTQYLSLIELFKNFGIKNIEIYIGILFDTKGNPATRQSDKDYGFYSSNEEGYKDLRKLAISLHNVEIQKENSDTLTLTMNIKGFEDITLTFASIYGNEVPKALFGKEYSLLDLLILRYDDIWLGQLTAISERSFLLKYGQNYTLIIKDILKKDFEARKLYDKFITSEGSEEILIELVNYLFERYSEILKKDYVPIGKQKEEYLSDVLQLLAAVEA
ncbi:MAG: hypothetical protein QXS74_09560 [Nitrososphaeria archaeon]